MKQKLSFLSAILVSVVLASCTTTEPVDPNANANTSAPVEAAPVVQTIDPNAAIMAALASVKTVYYFNFDEATLTDESRAALDQVAPAVKAAGIAVRLEGHADERGTPEYNLALGERRAKSVANYLTMQGVDAAKIETISYGEEKPVMTGSDEASWAKNRRVELVK